MAHLHPPAPPAAADPARRVRDLIAWADTALNDECDRQYLIEDLLDRLHDLASGLDSTHPAAGR